MSSLLLSPHDDDAALFAAFTCQREHPLIVVCLDSYVQPKRGETGCSARERSRETLGAHAFFRCDTFRLGLRDDAATEFEIQRELDVISQGFQSIDAVYAPALQGGNIHHDMVARAAIAVFDKVRQYTTYTKTELYTTGNIEIVPTERELELKNRALDCYESQLRINRPHFDAVRGKSEWLL